MTIKLTEEQEHAVSEALRFLKAPRVNRNWFSIQGLAGSGKSTVLATIAQRVRGAMLCAPTGKAASVLSRKVGAPTTTVHSAIYTFKGAYTDESGEQYLSFQDKIESGAWHRKVALCDEAGMIDVKIAEDLLATGCRVIATGDPGQLPPVRGTRFFDTADVTLETIHRQALESAIIRQAHNMRFNGVYAADGPDFRVQNRVEREDILAADVVLCYRNATRHALNALVRGHKGFEGVPRRGETVVCLRNDHELGIMNGAQYTLLSDYDARRRVVVLVNERGHTLEIENCRFETVEGVDGDVGKDHPFGLGHVLTCHKYQGSEAKKVILVDEYDKSEWRREWVYTAITRASEKILVYRSW